jgi:cytochrome c oxidase subunit 2
MSSWKQFWFQDRISPIIEEFLVFHDLVFLVITFIFIIVFMIAYRILTEKVIDHALLEGQVIEWLWTVIPGGFLFFIAIPSLRLLYIYDEYSSYAVRIKAVGHQWYWRYEFIGILGDDVTPVEFDSYLIPENSLDLGGFRLLDTDTHCVVPLTLPIQLIITSGDVLHSWAIPCMGAKVDAVPGRLNMLTLYRYMAGLFFGQCSEICGANHRFIPITLEVVRSSDYISWLASMSAQK